MYIWYLPIIFIAVISFFNFAISISGILSSKLRYKLSLVIVLSMIISVILPILFIIFWISVLITTGNSCQYQTCSISQSVTTPLVFLVLSLPGIFIITFIFRYKEAIKGYNSKHLTIWLLNCMVSLFVFIPSSSYLMSTIFTKL